MNEGTFLVFSAYRSEGGDGGAYDCVGVFPTLEIAMQVGRIDQGSKVSHVAQIIGTELKVLWDERHWCDWHSHSVKPRPEWEASNIRNRIVSARIAWDHLIDSEREQLAPRHAEFEAWATAWEAENPR